MSCPVSWGLLTLCRHLIPSSPNSAHQHAGLLCFNKDANKDFSFPPPFSWPVFQSWASFRPCLTSHVHFSIYSLCGCPHSFCLSSTLPPSVDGFLSFSWINLFALDINTQSFDLGISLSLGVPTPHSFMGLDHSFWLLLRLLCLSLAWWHSPAMALFPLLVPHLHSL